MTATPTYIVSFTNVSPPLRYDGLPWTEVIVSESSDRCGDYTQIATVDLSSAGGLDTDPTRPAERSFTVSGALECGWYTLTWQDAAGNQSRPTAPVHLPDAADELRPTLEEVGSISSARTVASGTGGTELGTFTDQTVPTDVQVERLIDQAIRMVILKTGPGIQDEYRDEAKTVVLYLTAALIELSYYKEDIAKQASPYPMLDQNYKDALQALLDSIENDTPGSPTQSFFSVPVQNSSQAHWRAYMQAMDPETGLLDPTLLPPDMAWPNGLGGLPEWAIGVGNAPYPFLDWINSGSFLNQY